MKILPTWHEEPISRECHRELFDCGNAELNAYLKLYARKNHCSGEAQTFLAIDDRVAAWYASYGAIPLSRYSSLPYFAIYNTS